MSKKSIALLLSIVLAIGGIAYGSVAYLTARDSVANVFTVGAVNVKVDETVVDKDGQPVDKDGNPTDDPQEYIREEAGNEYHLIPGSTYWKDPMVTVVKGSEECYVRMKLTIACASELKAIFDTLTAEYPNGFLPQEHQTGWDSTLWPCVSMEPDETANTIICEFRYYQPVTAPAEEDLALEPLFKTITVPTAFTTDQLATLSGFTVTAVGEAIQTANFLTADEAWAAFDKQYGE